MNEASPPPSAPKCIVVPCADPEAYVTARLAVVGSPRQPYCRGHAEEYDAKGAFAVKSARRVARP